MTTTIADTIKLVHREGCVIHDVEQGSPEWFKVRAGIPTASEFDSLITPLWKPRTGEGVQTYLAKKLAERWLGRPLMSGGSFATEQGNVLEDEAVPFYEMMHDIEIQRVGFITTSDGRAGCSPDGLIGDNGMGIEIKCPQPHTHAAYLLAGELPKDYAAQVHGSMYVTGASEWKFMSYCRLFPPLILTVKRDVAIIEAIRESVTAFCDKLEAGFLKLQALKGNR